MELSNIKVYLDIIADIIEIKILQPDEIQLLGDKHF